MNIRTVNDAKRNPRPAVLDAWEEFGETLPLDLVAHMHRLSIDQIEKDMFGEPFDIKEKFGLTSIEKLKHRLRKCLEEINQGLNPALVSVSNHIPFVLLRELGDNPNIDEVAKRFLAGIREKIDNIEREKSFALMDDTIEVRYVQFKRICILKTCLTEIYEIEILTSTNTPFC